METLKVYREGAAGWIQFNRPLVRNAVNRQMMQELEEQIRLWEQDDRVKVLVLTGNARGFVSGGDLDELHQHSTAEEVYPFMRRMGQVLHCLHQLEKPTVAAVQGAAVGGGCEIAASCDFRLASENARFAFVQSRMGITSGWGGGSRLLSQMDRGIALRWLLTGDWISAREAWEAGWVHQLVPDDSFTAHVQRFADNLCHASLGVITNYVRLVRASVQGAALESLAEMEARSCSQLWETEEHRQAVKSFLQRRDKPSEE
ncbi:2,3-dehydroadipyl-CoA hydratase [Marinithermofilum abyssi]|uniref:2,3-dehydroadipyl-CoA hydratase n=1 Tax=Marinithermofilum abyssi TaxID=1571185 RepID=A0A8J2VIZ1_9BACL|nr:enoyl-CoA hydratase/isomerase family protein [Marinithermofilum abyssi]GGE22724.1 2,3-dehydroadipyl-CoA hydratase [Marinithermofilum abyssi]